MKIYNGAGKLLGRIAALAAKDALLGEEVRIINAEKMIISGRKEAVFAREKQRYNRQGYPLKTHRHTRSPDRFVRRSIRGMLPWKTTRGREAYRRIFCYNGVPSELATQPSQEIESASSKKLPTLRYVTVEQVCQYLGGKIKHD